MPSVEYYPPADMSEWSGSLLERRTRYVDSDNDDPNPDGTFANPYKTIQAAVDDLAAIPGIGSDKTPRTVRVVGGRVYDEDVVIPQTDGGLWVLIAHVFTFLGIIPTSPRSVSRVVDPAYKISGVNPVTSLFATEGGAWIISGNVAISDTGVGQTTTVAFEDVSVVGVGATYALDGTGMTAELFVGADEDLTLVGKLNAPTGVLLDESRHSTFQNDVVLQSMQGGQALQFLGDVTVTEAGTGYLQFCRIDGDWTGPYGSLRADQYTANAHQGSLLGGATVDLLDGHSPVDLFLYAGSATVAVLDGLTPTKGEAYVMSDAGTPAAGSSDALVPGDGAEFDGESWIKIWDANGSSHPPAGTRALVATTVIGIALRAPLSHPGDQNKVVEWDGTSDTPAALLTPKEGQQVWVRSGVYTGGQLTLTPVMGFVVWLNAGNPLGAWGDGLGTSTPWFPKVKIGEGLFLDGGEIKPDVDGTTIDIFGSQLHVKDDSIGETQLADEAYTTAEQTKLSGIEEGADVTNETNVLAALAASTTDKDMGGAAVTNVGNVDGVDVSDLGSTVTTLSGDVSSNTTHRTSSGTDHSALKNNVVDAVVYAPDATGGATQIQFTLDIKDLDGNALSKVCEVVVQASTSQYGGALTPNGNCTMSSPSKGGWVQADHTDGRWQVYTDSAGQFIANISNSNDEQVWFSARSVDGGVSETSRGVVVRSCVPDDATWSA